MIRFQSKDKDFYKKINKIYRKYKIKNKKQSIKEICFPKKYKLQVQQDFLSKYIGPNTQMKSLLVFHKIGAGKTCTAIRIAEEWVGKKNIMIVLPASLIGGFRNELRSMCAENNYISQKDMEYLKELSPSSKDYKKIIKKSDEEIDKYYDIMSYNKFVDNINIKKIKLKNTLLIIDEIQNMVSENGIYYKTLHKTIMKSDDKCRFVIMTATPMFDKPIELALTLNLLRKDIQLPIDTEFDKKFIEVVSNEKDEFSYNAINLDIIKNFSKGMVSYYRGAPPYVFPKAQIKIVKCEMQKLQYDAYKTVSNNETKKVFKKYKNKEKIFKANAIEDLPNNFFIGTRIVSNILYPNFKINENGLNSFKGKYTTSKLEKFSIKFYKILSKIKHSRGPVFVYSNFKEYGGIKSFQKVLEDNGFENYLTNGTGKNRFAVWSGDENLKTREEMKTLFNNINNINGDKIKIMLGTPAIKEGVSLLRVKQVHIIEPTWNWSKMMQIMGRAVRFCSHKDLPVDERIVKIYVYIATHKGEETTDQYILNLAIQKHKLISKFEHALKESAIDCTLFKNANYYKNKDEEKIYCSN